MNKRLEFQLMNEDIAGKVARRSTGVRKEEIFSKEDEIFLAYWFSEIFANLI